MGGGPRQDVPSGMTGRAQRDHVGGVAPPMRGDPDGDEVMDRSGSVRAVSADGVRRHPGPAERRPVAVPEPDRPGVVAVLPMYRAAVVSHDQVATARGGAGTGGAVHTHPPGTPKGEATEHGLAP